MTQPKNLGKLSASVAYMLIAASPLLAQEASQKLAIESAAQIDTSYGHAHNAQANFSILSLQLIPSFDNTDQENRCTNLRKFIADGIVDKTSIDTILSPNPKPKLRIALRILQPEYDAVWKAALDQYLSERPQTFQSYGVPYRPKILELGISLDASQLKDLDTLELAKFREILNKSVTANRPSLEQNGFFYLEIDSALIPCILSENVITARSKAIFRSFDTVQSTRLITEKELHKIVRDTESQIAKDNDPPGYVGKDNIEQFIYFRSIESIGRVFTWLEKEKVTVWKKFVANWTERLGGKVRPLTEDELFSAGAILTSTTYTPTLIYIATDATQVTISEK